MITTQFIKDEEGKKLAVIIPMAEYEKMLEDIEELEDIRLYDEVKARNESSITLEEYIKKKNFDAIKIDTTGFTFNREEANER